MGQWIGGMDPCPSPLSVYQSISEDLPTSVRGEKCTRGLLLYVHILATSIEVFPGCMHVGIPAGSRPKKCLLRFEVCSFLSHLSEACIGACWVIQVRLLTSGWT